MKTKILTGSMIAAYALLNTTAFAEETTELDPIVVSADFREAKLSHSVSIIIAHYHACIFIPASTQIFR